MLPFENLSEESGNEFFVDGLVEDLLNRISVIEELKVAYILEGSVQRYGQKARVTVQLIDAKNDDHIWADSYDRDIEDIFQTQSEIALKIASELDEILTSEQESSLQEEKTENAFQRALVLNPNYSTAHKYYAEHLYITGQNDKARMHMDKAVELDPLSFIVRFTSAQFYYHQGYFNEALRELDISDEIQAGHRWTQEYRFYCYWQLGQEKESYEALKRWIQPHPVYNLETADSIFSRSGLKAVLEWTVELDIARAEEHPTYAYSIAKDLAMLGRYEEALNWLEKASQIHSMSPWISFDFRFRSLHDNPRFQAILREMGLASYFENAVAGEE